MPFDLDSLLPELLLAGTVLLLGLWRLVPALARVHAAWLALVGVGGALAVCWMQWGLASDLTPPTFGGLLLHDALSDVFRFGLIALAALTLLLVLASGLVPRTDAAAFCALIVGATLGLVLLTSARHLLLLIVALELASWPCYLLVAWRRDDPRAGEAALKFALYGSAAVGVLIYGASLLAGHYGTGSLPSLAAAVAVTVQTTSTLPPLVLVGLVFVGVGLAYKLGVVPFHVWVPDALEGATAEVAGFLSVASLAATVGVVARLCFLFAGLDPLVVSVPTDAWQPLVAWLLPALAILAGVTCTYASLAAFWQVNAQRLLAYGTVAHVGFLLMGIAALTPAALAAVLVYLVAYGIATLGAFAVLAFVVRQEGMSADLRDLRGLVRRAPVLTVAFALFVLSLLGLPPLLGFFGKFNLFLALYQAAQAHPAQANWLLGLLVVAAVNTVLGAVYYLGLLRVLILEQRVEDLEGNPPQALTERPAMLAYAGVLAVLVVALLATFEPVVDASRAGAERYAAKVEAEP